MKIDPFEKTFMLLGVGVLTVRLIAIAIILILVAHIPVTLLYLPAEFTSPGIRVW